MTLHKGILGLLVLAGTLFAYPAHTWQHLASEHFTLSFNERTAHLAEEALRVAEEVHGNLRPLWGEKFFKEKISIALFDDEDDSNGAAYYYQSYVQILCRRTPFFWRGETHWLRTVLSHELSHIYTLRGLGIPLTFSLSAGYVSSKNKVASGVNLSFYHNNLPVWFTEALAQYGSREFGADVRDAWREMLLRDAFLSGKLLPLEAMNRFEGTSREYELAYNQGFDFLIFLAKQGGLKSLAGFNASILKYGFEEGIRRILGKKLSDLHAEWKRTLAERYASFALPPAQNAEPVFLNRGGPLVTETWRSTDGAFVVANWHHDYQRLDLLDVFSDKCLQDVGNYFCEDPSRRLLIFTRLVWNEETGAMTYDLFSCDPSMNESRLTRGERVLAFAYEKYRLVYAAYRNGVVSLKEFYLDGNWRNRSWNENRVKIRTLRVLPKGEEVFHMALMGKDVLLSVGKQDRLHGAVLRGEEWKEPWEGEPGDMLDFFADGDTVYFVSTRDGTPQIYSAVRADANADFGEWRKLTSVRGGARYPKMLHTSRGDRLQFSEFREGNFRLMRQDIPATNAATAAGFANAVEKPTPPSGESRSVPFKKTLGNFVNSIPSLGIAWSLSDPRTAGNVLDTSGLFALASWGIEDAVGDFSLGGSAAVDTWGFLNGKAVIPYQRYTADLSFALGPFRVGNHFYFDELFATNKTAEEGSFGRDRTFFADSALSWQFDERWSASLSFRAGWENEDYGYQLTKPGYVYKANGKTELSYIYPEVFRSLGGGLDLNYFHSLGSRLNLAGLGGDAWGFGVSLSASHYQFNAAYWDAFYSGRYQIEPNALISQRSRIFYRKTFPKNIVSIQLGADLSSDTAAIPSTGLIPPYFYRYLGGDSFFSGFAPGWVWGNLIVHFSAELRVNPFLNLANGIEWFERFSFGLKYEDGYLFQIVPGRETSWFVPRSAELSIRFPFYLRRASPGNFLFKIAAPFLLPDSLAKTLPPFQIYGGLSL